MQEIYLQEVNVAGNSITSANIIRYTSGLSEGMTVQSIAFSQAVKRLWATGLFSDIQIRLDREDEAGLVITILVVENPVLGQVHYTGNKKNKDRDLDELLELMPGQRILPNTLNVIEKKIREHYIEAGYLTTSVRAVLTIPSPTLIDQNPARSLTRNLEIAIDEGKKVRIDQIIFENNVAFSDRRLRLVLQETKQQRWYLFWRSPFDEKKYLEDQDLLRTYYQNKGYRDFTILADTVVQHDAGRKLNVVLTVYEGPQYKYRDFSWAGNQLFSKDQLKQALDLQPGTAYGAQDFNLAVFERMQGLYMDRGYIYSQIQPQFTPVGEDSLDVHFLITENQQVRVNQINIVGNSKTRENVIRREMTIFPGDIFNREKLMRSQRNVWMLNYFANVDPQVYPTDDDDKVNLEITVEEKSSDQASANIGFTGEYGMTGGGSLAFNNFDLAAPFTSGNGQKLALSYTVGTNTSLTGSEPSKYRSFNLSFTDPMIFDTPNLVGFSLFHTYQGASTQYYYPLDINTTGGSLRWGRRLRWPDDYFRGNWMLQVTEKEYTGSIDDISYYVGYFSGPDSTRTNSAGVKISQTISRDSRDKPEFTSNGSFMSWTTTVSGGYLGGNEDFHKHQLNLDWYTPVAKKVALTNSLKLGYIGQFRLQGEQLSILPLSEKFIMGGTGITYGNMLRGYPDNSIGPQYDGSPVGGNTMVSWSTELRLLFSDNPVVYGLVFAEAGNVWESADMMEPNYLQQNSALSLKRSAGAGIRFFMPMVGILGFDMGYGFDDIDGDGKREGWNYHIIFGQNL
ncbi:MAG: outer membrane protein assembly factor BamA [Candidatus Neomarinimicrobiota bacterium]